MPDKRTQVVAQCRAVSALCTRLATVSNDYATLISSGRLEELLDIVGARTAEQMEILGDILNGMDAVAPGDEWMTPVFEEAQRLWPVDST